MAVALRDLPERDAQRCLDRYVREAPRRVAALLERVCAECPHIKPEQLDRGEESLVRVWEWLVQHHKRKLPPEFPPPDPWWLPGDPSAPADPDLAEWSDRIALYVAACFKAAFPDRGIRWRLGIESGLEPALRHQPLLSGFRAAMCPRLLVWDLAQRIPQGVHAGRTLCDAFQLWSDDVSPPRAGAAPAEG